MNFIVYILHSKSHDKFYIGQTDDLDDRLRRHNLGHNKSTAPYKLWTIQWSVQKSSRAEAMILEKKLKNLTKERIKLFIEKNT